MLDGNSIAMPNWKHDIFKKIRFITYKKNLKNVTTLNKNNLRIELCGKMFLQNCATGWLLNLAWMRLQTNVLKQSIPPGKSSHNDIHCVAAGKWGGGIYKDRWFCACLDNAHEPIWRSSARSVMQKLQTGLLSSAAVLSAVWNLSPCWCGAGFFFWLIHN